MNKNKISLLKVLEFAYYIIVFTLVDVLLHLVQGNPVNILSSFGFSAFFTLIFFVLMLLWMPIARKINK